MTQRLLLVDSASQYFRAFYALPDSIRDSSGAPVNAVRGFFSAVTRAVEQFRATRLVLCWDEDWRPQFRTDLLPSYKAQRVAEDGNEAIPEGLVPQIDMIVKVAAGLGLARIGAAGFEADDVIATIAAGEAGPVAVLTGDRDLFQVIDDRRDVTVWYTGNGPLRVYNGEMVRAAYGVTASQYADFATLRGDPSDGLPGVRGIGPKGAAALITEHKDLAGLLTAVDADSITVKPAQRIAILGARQYLIAAPLVVRVRTDVALPAYEDQLRIYVSTAADFTNLVRSAGLTTVIDRWHQTLTQARLA